MRFVLAIAFAVAHTQCPLYFSNQNQYFLHGLAAADYGDLHADWLANTADPTPLFSLLVQYLPAFIAHAIFFGLMMVYFLSLMSIARSLKCQPPVLPLAAFLIVIHSAMLRVLSVQLFGVDYPWYLQCGVANQYLLGPGLQPSCFGVLLLASMAAFLHERYSLAAILIAAACTMHSTYLLTGGILTAGYLFAQPKHALRVGAIALLGVIPTVIHASSFSHIVARQGPQPLDILAWVRIPHHTDPTQWLDVIAGLQLLMIIASVLFLRRDTTLCTIVIVALLLGSVFGATAALSHDAMLSLMFPWRVSTVLVPMAVTVIASRLLTSPQRQQGDFAKPLLALRACSILAIASAMFGAVIVYCFHFGYRETAAEAKLIEHVRATRQPGELYLLPTGFPPPPSYRGSYSSTFLPVGTKVNPFEMQRFRLGSGARAYVDFKSIPYRDNEVLEWHRRVGHCERWYRETEWDAIIPELKAEGVTHVIAPSTANLSSSLWDLVHTDAAYAIYRLR